MKLLIVSNGCPMKSSVIPSSHCSALTPVLAIDNQATSSALACNVNFKTWRSSLQGPLKTQVNQVVYLKDFSQSPFILKWFCCLSHCRSCMRSMGRLRETETAFPRTSCLWWKVSWFSPHTYFLILGWFPVKCATASWAVGTSFTLPCSG